MNDDLSTRLKPVKLGLLLSLLTILYAFGLGAAFGGWEDDVKGYIKDEAAAVKDDVYKGDEAKMKEITDKSWVYFKRAHMHASGLGAIALGVCLMVAFLPPGRCVIKLISTTALGAGALGYAMFWMLAGMRAPGLGSTGAAKETLGWLAKPATGLCVVGLLLAICLFACSCLCRCGCKKTAGD